MTTKQMKLSGFCAGSGSYHQAGWRHPQGNPRYGEDFSLWIDVAKKLEAAKFDMILWADLISPPNFDSPEIFRHISDSTHFEPMTWLAALTGHTKDIGLVGTVATSYLPPYDVARLVASLDLISGGRGGWNVVTGISPDDARQYADQTHPPQNERYAKGEEFVDVVLKLWASIEPGAFPCDQESGVFADLEKIHRIDHEGKYFRVKGPLGVSPSPQGRPVLVQAGQSEEGRQLASRIGELIFTAQSTFEQGKAFYDDVRRRAAAWGRNPDHVKVLPGCAIIVGESRQEAEDKWGEINELIDLRPAMARLAMALKFVELQDYDLDEPFPELPPEAAVSRGMHHVEAARREGLTLRQVLVRSSASNAHFSCRGTAADVADQMQHWFEDGACDGFNLLTSSMPTSLDDVLQNVIPELQRRGIFRTEYEGTTLRENLGIPLEPIPFSASSSPKPV